MRKNLFRFLLLKVLPGRLIPFLTVFEVLMLIRRLRAARTTAAAPRRVVVSQAAAPGPKVSVSTEPVPASAKPVTPR